MSYILLLHLNFIFATELFNNDDSDNNRTGIGTSTQSETVDYDNLPSATLLSTHNDVETVCEG